ncbi:uncharacterized protein LOC124805787 isoform X1 [Hydra vulgaris]|uniref:uncharacterized protein LOC124805787 isoform X1 n=1 Tax=Hydra vulgaris TaxID=6087 RepID=UPI001F5ECB46|nr:uncharacterized protein LOC124805787 isoform X1 [Hydra vulgaris]
MEVVVTKDVPLICNNLDNKELEVDPVEKTILKCSQLKKIRRKPPTRVCPFCGELHTKLNRHILNKHQKNEKVINIKLNNKITKKKLFQQFKKTGIMYYNRKQLSEKNPTYLRERVSKTNAEPVMCTGCYGFYARTYFKRHQNQCSENSCTSVIHLPITSMDNNCIKDLSEDFKKSIIEKLRDDEIGKVVKNDQTILMIGSCLYNKIKRKKDKQNEVRRSVRADMRRLAHLYTNFKKFEIKSVYNNATDMFLRLNFRHLSSAISNYTSSENEEQKSGLKHALCYLILNAAEKLVGHFLAQDNDKVADDICNFLKLFKLEKDNIFADANYDLVSRRNRKLKKPVNLPVESDIELLRNYTIETIKKIVNNKTILWDLHYFVLLRNCTVTRLTIFNARRGGEPARLLLSDWKDADEEVWLDQQRNNCDSTSKTKIAYQIGKGNRDVSIFIPLDTIEAMRILSDIKIRGNVGINLENPYVFASGKNSDSHCSGWHALTSVCQNLPLENKKRLTATTNRHRISTLLASVSMTDSERNLFYDHMGHSEAINKHIYQAPPAIMQLAKTGLRLSNLDKGQLCASPAKFAKIDHMQPINNYENDYRDELLYESDNSKCEAENKKGFQFSTSDKNAKNELVQSNSNFESKEKNRLYCRWTVDYETMFVEWFEKYLDKDAGWPDRKYIEKFQELVPFSYKTIRTKINNERKKWCNLVKHREKIMNM